MKRNNEKSQTPVAHGYWIPSDYSREIYFCSVCDGGDSSDHKGLQDRCLKCGAIMDMPVKHTATR